MSLETGYAAADAAFRSAVNHGYDEILFKYAGGEPLLCVENMSKLHRYAQTLAKKHNILIDGVVLSNGTLLTPEIIEQLSLLNLRLMISLDGIGTFHDCQRYYPDGQGSFDAVSKATDLAMSYHLIPDISVTISGRNIAGLPELTAWLSERNLPFSFNFYRENNRSASEKDLRLEEDKFIKGLLSAYKVIESHLNQRILSFPLADHADFGIPHLRPCSVGHSYLVFDHQGHVAKCQMDMGNVITDIFHADPLSQIRIRSNGIQNISVDEKEECQECQWRYWCAGGCPLLTYRATGYFNRKSPNCNIYKAIYSEIARLKELPISP